MESTLTSGTLIGAIFSASPDAVVVVDDNGTIVLTSPAVARLFGYFPEELVGEQLELLIPQDRRSRHGGHLEGFFRQPHARQMGAGLELEGLHREGETVPVDVSLAPVEVRGRHYVAAFVRDAKEHRRGLDRLHAVNEITQRLLRGARLEEVLVLVAERARYLVDAIASWVVTPGRSEHLVVSAAHGTGADELLGIELGESSFSAQVLATGKPFLLADFTASDNVPGPTHNYDFGPGLYIPLVAAHQRIGTLVMARSKGATPFDPLDIALTEVFASSAAVAMELGEARHELGRLQLVEEDERIARDLHDTVIQHLFAVGMSLQAVRGAASGPVAQRIDAAVGDLDNVIRDIRNTIFRLPGRSSEIRGLRDEMFKIAERFEEELGFSPRIDFHGPVDMAIPDEICEHLTQVLAEALSNVARHAQASSAEVIVELADQGLLLAVVDDGVGPSSGPFAGHGLRNMATRAEQLGGALSIAKREPSGTQLEWRIPLEP